ncbi:hypothetical protein M405DRAFT_861259, partial [Rhizopogon salebrosus TDB-379]
MSGPQLSRDDIALLSVQEIMSHAGPFMPISRHMRRNKTLLIDSVYQQAIAQPSHPLYEQLEASARLKLLVRQEKQTRKRKAISDPPNEPKRPRMADWQHSAFMSLPTDQERRDCHSRFIDATGSQALAQGVCAVCARECGVMDDKLTPWRLPDVPNGHRLIPAQSHPAHDLFDRMLLDPAGVTQSTAGSTAEICSSCINQLRDSRSSSPPALSLANGMWIGRVPWQLQVLTFPEQLLIALLYPR